MLILAIALSVGLGVGLSDARHHHHSSSSTAAVGAVAESTSANSAATTPTTASSPSATTASSATGLWKPAAGTSWQIDINDTPIQNTSINVPVYDIDLFGNAATDVSALQKAGRKVICYFSAGSFENWRPDAGSFDNATDLGAPLDGWPGEWWLNTNSANVRKIMTARIAQAKTKGCDAVDPDNIDAYENNGGGLSLTTKDAINYVQFLAAAAHVQGLAMGLKNGGGDGGILSSVVTDVEFSVNEQCVQYKECASYQPFITAGKPVFHIEYPGGDSDGTPQVAASAVAGDCSGSGSAQATGFSGVLKKMALDDWVIECPK